MTKNLVFLQHLFSVYADNKEQRKNHENKENGGGGNKVGTKSFTRVLDTKQHYFKGRPKALRIQRWHGKSVKSCGVKNSLPDSDSYCSTGSW